MNDDEDIKELKAIEEDSLKNDHELNFYLNFEHLSNRTDRSNLRIEKLEKEIKKLMQEGSL